ALVGGAGLIVFPLMLAVGIPPVAASATLQVAIAPANSLAALADRGKLPPVSPALLWMLAVTAAAGGVGGALLLLTPERWFAGIVPALIGFATLLFAFAEPIKRAIARRRAGHDATLGPVIAPIGLLSIYGGYFGAGLGVMYLALLTLGGISDLRTANALKNLMGPVCGIAAIAIFVWADAVIWPAAFATMAGSAIGGYAGGYAMRHIPPIAFRRGVVAVGAVMTASYAWRYWF
ncbi:MAG: sulfite exporter TauE/SafE family protein, partial [Tagaea sp.]